MTVVDSDIAQLNKTYYPARYVALGEVEGNRRQTLGLLEVAFEQVGVGSLRRFAGYVLPCGPENYTTQVLVQPKQKGRPVVEDVTELVGREVAVLCA